ITVECLVSVSICTIGIILAAGPLKPILIKHELSKKTIDEIDTHPSFNTFNHR
ncbi:31781_t:CDS:2, partial [Racocetra persica]